MKKLLALLLCSLQCFAAGAQFNAFAAHYSAPGTNTVNVTAVTGSGSAWGCVLFWINRTGSLGTPTCAGHAMTQVGTQVSLAPCGVTSQKYVYVGAGVAPGTVTVTGVQTGGSDNVLDVVIVDGASATQPDANAGLTSGNYVAVSGGQEAAMAITTAAANALVLGEYCGPVAATLASSNGTFAGTDGTFNVDYYYGTVNPSSAGLFNLQDKNGTNTLSAYAADGISITGLAPPFVSIDTTIIMVGP